MTNAEFDVYYKKYKPTLAAIARKFAGADADLFDDLLQAGAIGLFEADLSKPFKNEDAFLRNVIRNRMIDHLRWLDPDRYERLDKHMAQGAQVVKDPETNDITLLSPDAKRQSRDIDRLGMGQKGRGNSLGFSVSAEEDYDG